MGWPQIVHMVFLGRSGEHISASWILACCVSLAPWILAYCVSLAPWNLAYCVSLAPWVLACIVSLAPWILGMVFEFGISDPWHGLASGILGLSCKSGILAGCVSLISWLACGCFSNPWGGIIYTLHLVLRSLLLASTYYSSNNNDENGNVFNL